MTGYGILELMERTWMRKIGKIWMRKRYAWVGKNKNGGLRIEDKPFPNSIRLDKKKKWMPYELANKLWDIYWERN